MSRTRAYPRYRAGNEMRPIPTRIILIGGNEKFWKPPPYFLSDLDTFSVIITTTNNNNAEG